MTKVPIFGNRRNWAIFARRHTTFVDRLPNLEKAINLAFHRNGESLERLDSFVFFLGRVCADEFMEIMLLCGNGYGVGALKLVRSMYERAVTARYLQAHPDQLELFMDFHLVSQSKMAKAIRETFGDGVLKPEVVQDIEEQYERVKSKFLVTVCEKCGTQRVNHTWSKLDFVTMAGKTGEFGRLIVPAYYLPMRQTHSTLASVFTRLEVLDDGGLSFKGGAQWEEADDALITAHKILLNLLELQCQHFAINGLSAALQTCLQDFNDSWGNKDQQPSTSSSPVPKRKAEASGDSR